MNGLHLDATSIALNVDGYPPLYQSIDLDDDPNLGIVTDELSDHSINTVVAKEYGAAMGVGELIYSTGSLWVYVDHKMVGERPLVLMHAVQWSRTETPDEAGAGEADAPAGPDVRS